MKNPSAETATHPFDLDDHKLLQIKMVFPENQPSRRVINKCGVMKGVKVDELAKVIQQVLELSTQQVELLLESLDHADEEKVSWTEFTSWLTREGAIRNIANDQRLYTFTTTRLYEEEEFKMKQLTIQNLYAIPMDKGLTFQIVVYENRDVHLVSSKNFDTIHNFVFKSTYMQPKFISGHPVRKTRTVSASNPFSTKSSLNQTYNRASKFQGLSLGEVSTQVSRNLQSSTNAGRTRMSILKPQDPLNNTFDIQNFLKNPYRRDTFFDTQISVQSSLDTLSPRSISKPLPSNRNMLINEPSPKATSLISQASFSKKSRNNRSFAATQQKRFTIEPPKLQKRRMYGVLGLTDTTQDNQEIREILKLKMAGTSKDIYMHPFGISDNLFTPKYEVNKNERNFKSMIKKLELDIQQRESEVKLKKSENLLHTSLSKMSQEQKDVVFEKIQTQMNAAPLRQGSVLFNSTLAATLANVLKQGMQPPQGMVRRKTIVGRGNTFMSSFGASPSQNQRNIVEDFSTLSPAQIDQLKNRKELIRKRLDKVKGKLDRMEGRVGDIQEANQYFVKVADTCPVAIEINRKKKLQERRQMSEQQKEQYRLHLQNKQQYLEKISKELREKALLNAGKKKKTTLSDDSSEAEGEVKDKLANRNKKFENKKIYPVTISFHQESKLLAMCLIDSDIKIYQLKQSGVSIQVNEAFSFFSSFIPCCSFMARHKINNEVMLCLASQEGHVEIYSLAESDKGKSIWSTSMENEVAEYGPITKLLYHKDVGLIVSTFKGLLQVYDSMEFKLMWETHNGFRKEKTTITAFDYSQQAGLIAVGGVEGKIMVFDPSAKMVNSHAHIHSADIMDLYFYDKHMQLISVSIDRTIILWDSLKLECIQTIKDAMPQARFFSSSCFNYQKGILLTACIFIKVWKAKVDSQVEFESIQRKAVTKNALKEQVRRIKRQVELIQNQTSAGEMSARDKERKMQLQEELLASQTYITSGFENIQTYTSTSNVLVTKSSKLVAALILEKKQELVTLDSDYLMRVWSLPTGKQMMTLLLKSKTKKKLTCASIDAKEKHLAISDEEGQITIHNLHSAGILHQLQKVGTEMSHIQFFNEGTNFWLAAVGWEGKMALIKTPMFQKNANQSIPILLKTSVHKGDLYAVEHCDTYIATGGVDNKVCIWNSLSGSLRSKIDLPRDKPNTFICALKFVKTNQTTLLFVLQNTGELHYINPITETMKFSILQLHMNAQIDVSPNETLLCVGEQGKGSLYQVVQEEKNRASINSNHGMPRMLSIGLKVATENEISFDRFKEWTLHKINAQQNQSVIMCRFSKQKPFFITGTNHGEVKIWNLQGEFIAMVNQAEYPVEKVSLVLSRSYRQEAKLSQQYTKDLLDIVDIDADSEILVND